MGAFMKSSAVVIAFLMLAACRTTLDTNTNGSVCSSTPVTCGAITCGPFERCDTSGASAVCICGLIALNTTANATGCACSGTDSAHPGCGAVTSNISSEAQCFTINDMSMSDGPLPDIFPFDDGNADLATGPRQCATAGTPVMCGVVLCTAGAWCDISTPSSPVCRCGDSQANPGCTCSGMPDPNNMGCLLGPPVGC
jgi:hypothetical protein